MPDDGYADNRVRIQGEMASVIAIIKLRVVSIIFREKRVTQSQVTLLPFKDFTPFAN